MMPRLLFVATEDWFFKSHFMPLAEQAAREGYDVLLAARDTGALTGVENVRLINMPFARGSLRPWEVRGQIAHLRAIIAREQPVLIHAIALKPIALTILARVRDAGRVFAVTGRGYLSLGRAPWTKFVSWRLRRMLRRELRRPGAVLLVENTADQAWVEHGDPLQGNSVLMPGAGVEIDKFTLAPEPQTPPVIVGVVARLVWSKGVDLAVEAVRRLRGEGLDVRLRIAGAPDPQNPEHVSEDVIQAWRDTDGVEAPGRIEDVNGFWRAAHIACLPSRGGEGLPRSLLEAAACGRPLVTTAVPGCAEFVRNDVDGFVVAPNAQDELTDALRRLVSDSALRARLGAAARDRVVQSYSVAHAGQSAARAWRLALEGRA